MWSTAPSESLLKCSGSFQVPRLLPNHSHGGVWYSRRGVRPNNRLFPSQRARDSPPQICLPRMWGEMNYDSHLANQPQQSRLVSPFISQPDRRRLKTRVCVRLNTQPVVSPRIGFLASVGVWSTCVCVNMLIQRRRFNGAWLHGYVQMRLCVFA